MHSVIPVLQHQISDPELVPVVSRKQIGLSHDALFSVSESDKWQSLCVSCFCPCLIFGYIESKIKREITWSSTRSCFKSPTTAASSYMIDDPASVSSGFGSSGCIICVQTALLAGFAWPFSPLISLYLCCQRSHLRDIYERNSFLAGDILDATDPSCCSTRLQIKFQDLMDSCCFRSKVLLQHQSFLDGKNDQGLLFFKWENDVIINEPRRKSAPSLKRKIAFIVGPAECGKSTLFCKLLGVSIDPKDSKPRDNDKSQTGMKCTTAKNNKLEFIEIWDIPTPNLNSIGVRELIPNICSVMFVFDCISLDDEKEKKNGDSNLTSFQEMKIIYSDFMASNAEYFEKNDIVKICVASKVDLLEDDDSLEEKLEEMRLNKFHSMNRRKPSREINSATVAVLELSDEEKLFMAIEREKCEKLKENQDMVLFIAECWARDHGLKFIRTSSMTNVGITDILHSIQN